MFVVSHWLNSTPKFKLVFIFYTNTYRIRRTLSVEEILPSIRRSFIAGNTPTKPTTPPDRSPHPTMSTVDLVRNAYLACLESLRVQAYDLRQQSFDKLQEAFRTVNWDGSGMCDKQDFGDVLNYCGLFLSTQQVASIYKEADKGNTGRLDVEALMNDLILPLNARRANIVQIAWKSVAPDGGFVDQDALCASYNAKGHPDVRCGNVTVDAQAATFAQCIPIGGADEEIFTSYWRDIGAVSPRDDYFVQLVESVFLVKENQDVVNKDRLLQLVNILRNKVIQKKKGGESQKVTLLRNLKFQDNDDADKLNAAEFNEAFRYFGIPLRQDDTDGFFYLYGRSDGTMSIKTFLASFMGETKSCEDMIRDA